MIRWIWLAVLLSFIVLNKAEDADHEVKNAQMDPHWGVFGIRTPDNTSGVAEITNNGLKASVTFGYNTKIGQYPYVAVILIYYYGYFYHICGGVIYNQHTILTSAHCLIYIKKYQYYVAVGIRDLRLGMSNPGSQRIKVTSYLIHPQYEPYGYGYPNDIAALHLACRIKYNFYVKPAPLATKYDGLFTHAGCYMVGWGRTEWGYPHILQTAFVRGLSNYMCQLWWAVYYKAKIYGSHFCVYRYPVSGCYGDSGGPVVCHGKVVGLMSWVDYGCTGCRPTVSARVSSFSAWIKTAGILD